MENKKSIELITLEVLGSLDADDRNNLQFLKETDENFPWKIQAEFQNLSALLPSILKITEQPSAVAKERMINKLSQIVTPIAANNQTNKYIFNSGEKHSDNDHLEEILNKNKIDWGSLAVSKQMPQHKSVTGYEEVKPKVPVSREDSVKIEITKAAQENEKLPEVSEVEFDDEIEKRNTSSSRLKKYVIVSIILFVVSLSLFGYLFIFNQSDTQKTLTEKKVDENIISAPVEEFFYNNVQEPESSVSASDVQTIENENKVETKAETKTEPELNNKNKNLLPKAPPKVPDSIDEKQIVTTQISSTLDVKEKEEISAPLPEEVIEENEEPTYFVAVEEMPQPIGGLQAIQKLIQYPEIAKRAGIQGKVFVKAFIDENGNVISAEVVKGIGGGCDEAALDAIFKTKFTPGKQRGKPVKVQVTVSVLFQL